VGAQKARLLPAIIRMLGGGCGRGRMRRRRVDCVIDQIAVRTASASQPTQQRARNCVEARSALMAVTDRVDE